MIDDEAPSNDPELATRVLAELPVAEPPAGFADAVMAARAAEAAVPAPRPPRTGSRWGRAVLLGSVAAATAAVALIMTRAPARHDVHGQGRPTARESLHVGTRGIAVAEAGSALDWTVVASGAAHVAQPEGNVFYRVEPGGPFVVTTPAGDVIVKGTCFRVEVLPVSSKKQLILAASAGALVSATVLITVYEGHVMVKSASGQAEAHAGERIAAAPDHAPTTIPAAPDTPAATPPPAAPLPPPADSTTRAELLTRDQAQRDQIAALTAKVAELEHAAPEATADGRPRGESDPATSKMSDFSKDEWLAMAKKCEVRWALPPMGLEPPQVSADRAEQLGLTPAERTALNQGLAHWNDKILKDLRALYVEITGDAAAAENLDAMALAAEITEKSPKNEDGLARRAVDEEMAGVRPVPAGGGSPSERYYRLMLSAKGSFEEELAKVVGEARAHDAHKGFDGNRSISRGCPGEHGPGGGAGD